MTSLRIAPLLATLAALACAGPSPAADEAAYDRTLAEMGAEVFEQKCASCHGVDASGDGPVATSLRTAPADLTRIAARRDGVFPDGEIARYIDGRFETAAHGPREMPVWGERFGEWIPEASISEEIARGKIATLIEYLKSIQRSE